jgi:hypothetical protein
VGFANFDDCGELFAEARVFLHSEANAARHVPGGLIGSSKLRLKLFGRDTFFRRANQANRQKPFGKGQMGIMENASGCYGILIAAVNALIQVAFFASLAVSIKLKNMLVIATDATKSSWPADTLEVSDALLQGGL